MFGPFEDEGDTRESATTIATSAPTERSITTTVTAWSTAHTATRLSSATNTEQHGSARMASYA